MNNMKLRIYSDIHLDHYNEDNLWYPPLLPDDKETILILAGDLWVGTRWIEHGENSWISRIASQFKQVLIVLGNHDYWPQGDLTILKGAEKCNSMLMERCLYNVKILDRDTWESEGFLFIGATLWTDMNSGDPLTTFTMPQFMRYDGKIAYETGSNGMWSRFTSQKWISTHCKHRDFISMMAKENKDKKLIVITHHIPLLTLGDPLYEGQFTNGYYHSDLSEVILDNPNIKYWFYGHTHHQKKTQLEHCTLINNCVGYQGEHCEQEGLVRHEVLEI